MILNLSRREAALLDRALDAYICTDEHPSVQALIGVREKLGDLYRSGAWHEDDGAADLTALGETRSVTDPSSPHA